MIITSPRDALFVRHVIAWRDGRITRGECEQRLRLESFYERRSLRQKRA